MNNRINKIIIILIILILILIISIILLIALKNIEKEDIYEYFGNISAEVGSSFLDDYGEKKDSGISRNAYYDIITCMTTYLNTINLKNSSYYTTDSNGNNLNIVSDIEINNSIINLLSKNYINKNNITSQNVRSNVKLLNSKCVFIPLEAQAINDSNIDSFLVHGLVENLIDFKIEQEIFFVININAAYNIFSIEPIYGNYKSINEIKITTFEKELEQNENNTFYSKSISGETMANNYLNMYKRLALGAPEILYNKLDEEYKQKRFGSLENFKKYIDENKQTIIGIRLEEYLIDEENKYTRYVAKDQYENMYIFNEIATLNYNIILDTYTLEQPKFTTEYSKANNQKKVMMNIDKFFQMINNYDYKAAYNCLADGFKQNYFKTEESFKSYIKNNLYRYNKVTYVTYNDKNSGVYGYELIIKDKQNANNSKKFNIVMKLNSGTDFEMSFEV